MPTYQYQCSDGHETNRVQSIHDFILPIVKCSSCNADAKRKFALPGVKFKGLGWGGNGDRPVTMKRGPQ